MSSWRFLWASTSFVLVFLVSFLLQILIYSPISPDPLHLPVLSSSDFAPNNMLQLVVKIGEGYLEKPEDVCVDKRSGTLYTATRDGWIKRMRANGSWEDWKMIGGEALLGLAMSMDGSLIVCDAAKGLLKVSDAGVTVLASEVAGSKIRYLKISLFMRLTTRMTLSFKEMDAYHEFEIRVGSHWDGSCWADYCSWLSVLPTH